MKEIVHRMSLIGNGKKKRAGDVMLKPQVDPFPLLINQFQIPDTLTFSTHYTASLSCLFFTQIRKNNLLISNLDVE